MRVFFGNIPKSTTARDLAQMATTFGEISAAAVVVDKATHRTIHLGCADFSNKEEAEWTVEAFDGKDFDGWPLVVTARPPKGTRRRGYRQWVWSHRVESEEHADDAARIDEEFEWFVPPSPALPLPPDSKALRIIAEFNQRLAQAIADSPAELNFVEWRDFERLLAEACRAIGFDVRSTTGSSDGGVDLHLTGIHETYVVQLKHWRSGKRVGPDVLRSLITVAIRDVSHAVPVVISSSGFSDSCMDSLSVVERRRIRLGDAASVVSVCRAYVRSRAFGVYRPLPDVLLQEATERADVER